MKRNAPVVGNPQLRPNSLSPQPKRATQSEQHPESLLAPVGGDCINKQGPIHKKRHQAKDDVGRRSTSRARGNPLANADVSTQQDEPGGCDVPITSGTSGGGFHSPTDP